MLEEELKQQQYKQTREKKREIFKNWAPFTDCISEINSVKIHNAKDLDAAMPFYNLIEYSDNYCKRSGRLRQYFRDELNVALADSESFKSKIKLTEVPLLIIQRMLK